MNWAEVLLLIALVVGFFGTIIPMVPGLGLMFGAILLYGFYDGWCMYSPMLAVLAGVFTALGMGIDYAGSAIGAKKFGASKHGVIASVIGGVIGSRRILRKTRSYPKRQSGAWRTYRQYRGNCFAGCFSGNYTDICICEDGIGGKLC